MDPVSKIELHKNNGSNNKITVIIVVSNLEYGGAQRQIVELANSMNSNEFELHICSMSNYVPLKNQLKNFNNNIHIIEKRHKFDFTVAFRLAALFKRIRADIAHSYLFDAEIATRLAGRLYNQVVVVGSERNTNYKLNINQMVAYTLTNKMVDLIIANSNAGARFNSHLLNYPKSMYKIVHNGVDTDRFKPYEKNKVRRDFGIEQDVPVVGMFASYKKQKNHPLFLIGARRVLNKIPNAKFLLIGDMLHDGLKGTDKYKNYIMQITKELNLDKNIVFMANCDDVEKLYCACDLTVLPSFYEGTPNVLLESMACGVPVICTNISDNHLIVKDGSVGYIVGMDNGVELSNRICELILNSEKRISMGDEAIRWVNEGFSNAVLAQKTENIYKSLVGAA